VQEELDHLNTTIVQLRELHASPVTSNDDTEQVRRHHRLVTRLCAACDTNLLATNMLFSASCHTTLCPMNPINHRVQLEYYQV